MTAKAVSRIHPVHLMNADWAPTLRPSQSTCDLGCESAGRLHAVIHVTIAVSYYYSTRFTIPLSVSRPRHCSKGAQPVPKAVYRSGCGVIQTRVLSHRSRTR